MTVLDVPAGGRQAIAFSVRRDAGFIAAALLRLLTSFTAVQFHLSEGRWLDRIDLTMACVPLPFAFLLLLAWLTGHDRRRRDLFARVRRTRGRSSLLYFFPEFHWTFRQRLFGGAENLNSFGEKVKK